MLKNKNVTFYAPIKPPDHHIPSGDRLIAQNIMNALQLSNANDELCSRYIAYSKRYDSEILIERKAGAITEATTLVEKYLAMTVRERPQIWLTYHPYCKAPDWIGPIVSKALNIPYVTIEAAKTGQGGVKDSWQDWRKEAQNGIIQADKHLVFKPTDRAYLSQLLGTEEKLEAFTPFINAENIEIASHISLPKHWQSNTPVLITTGMMRKGKKEQNFQILAETLKDVKEDYNLIIVGGGPEEAAIKSAFSYIDKTRVHWTGAIDHSDVLRWMRSCDIFIWPGWKEPIGMVYLEAQLQELPIVAYNSMGVPLVVKNNQTGLLATEGDPKMLAINIERLLADKTLRKDMGTKGRMKVLSQHGIKAAAERLDQVLSKLL